MLFISESEAHNLTFLVKRSSKQTFAESKRVCTFPGILLFEFLEIVDIHMKKLNKYIKKKEANLLIKWVILHCFLSRLRCVV